jgi:DNA replication and repair protein RecF
LRLVQITPHSFRNLSPDPVFFGSGLHVVAGENGQGKTNLLEAAAIVCGQRSFRRALPAACAPDGESFAVSAEADCEAAPERLRVEWARNGGRRFFRGEKSASFREISEIAPAVFLAPEHRELLAGSPDARRRFLDRLVLSCRPSAGEDLNRFARALGERNALLSRGPARGAIPDDELAAWTEELALSGTAVRRHRAEALSEWRGFFHELAAEAGPEYAQIRVDYAAGDETVEDLRRACERLLPAEKKRGHSLCGPHRDDFAWSRRGRAFAAEASSGEAHRAAALAKLAEWHAVARVRERRPIFAADDFDAGLSRAAAEAFLASLPPAEQTILTTASDPARWKGRAAILVVRGGRTLGAAPDAATAKAGTIS